MSVPVRPSPAASPARRAAPRRRPGAEGTDLVHHRHRVPAPAQRARSRAPAPSVVKTCPVGLRGCSAAPAAVRAENAARQRARARNSPPRPAAPGGRGVTGAARRRPATTLCRVRVVDRPGTATTSSPTSTRPLHGVEDRPRSRRRMPPPSCPGSTVPGPGTGRARAATARRSATAPSSGAYWLCPEREASHPPPRGPPRHRAKSGNPARGSPPPTAGPGAELGKTVGAEAAHSARGPDSRGGVLGGHGPEEGYTPVLTSPGRFVHKLLASTMDRTERLLDLVALLLDSHEPVSWAELKESFPEDYGSGSDEADRAEVRAGQGGAPGAGHPPHLRPGRRVTGRTATSSTGTPTTCPSPASPRRRWRACYAARLGGARLRSLSRAPRPAARPAEDRLLRRRRAGHAAGCGWSSARLRRAARSRSSSSRSGPRPAREVGWRSATPRPSGASRRQRKVDLVRAGAPPRRSWSLVGLLPSFARTCAPSTSIASAG